MEDKFGTSGIDFLLEAFNLTNYLLDEKEKCDGQRHPYSPSVNGWNIGISYSNTLNALYFLTIKRQVKQMGVACLDPSTIFLGLGCI